MTPLILSPEKLRRQTLLLSKTPLPVLASPNYASLGLFCAGPSSATVVATLYFSDGVCQEGDRKF